MYIGFITEQIHPLYYIYNTVQDNNNSQDGIFAPD